jgi:hypothetical protein
LIQEDLDSVSKGEDEAENKGHDWRQLHADNAFGMVVVSLSPPIMD